MGSGGEEGGGGLEDVKGGYSGGGWDGWGRVEFIGVWRLWMVGFRGEEEVGC